MLVFSLTACGDKTDTEVNNDSVQSDLQEKENQEIFDEQKTTENTSFTPYTVMDLFDGERRIWYYIESKDELSYDNNVKFVFVTENKKVVDFYYSLGTFPKYEAYPDWIKITPANTPVFSDYFVLSDFAEKNDDEILEMVRSRYADASQTYDFSLEYKYAQMEVTGSPFVASDLPYEIKYKGELDASGNNLDNEKVNFLDKNYGLQIVNTQYNKYEYKVVTHDAYFQEIVRPTIIKDKEYVGFKGSSIAWWITENTYASFDRIVYDSPDGASEW